jgi:hypothetical protein
MILLGLNLVVRKRNLIMIEEYRKQKWRIKALLQNLRIDALSLDGMVVAHHSSLSTGGVCDQGTLHFSCSNAMTADVDHIIHAASTNHSIKSHAGEALSMILKKGMRKKLQDGEKGRRGKSWFSYQLYQQLIIDQLISAATSAHHGLPP